MKIIFNSHYTTTKRTPNPEIPGFIKTGFQTDVVKYSLFYKHCVYLSPYDFSNFSLILCLQYAKHNTIYCHGHHLITALDGRIRIDHTKSSETAIQWCSFTF